MQTPLINLSAGIENWIISVKGVTLIYSILTHIKHVIITGLLVLLWPGVPSNAQSDHTEPLKTIVLKEGETLRDVAEEHFGNPDLWPELLRTNHIDLGAVKPGLSLRIIATQQVANEKIKQANAWLQKTLDISGFVKETAKVESAEKNLNNARENYKKGFYARAYKDAAISLDESKFSHEYLSKLYEKNSQATLAQISGQVETKRRQDILWKGSNPDQALYSWDKVRTLAKSQAMIEFVDKSTLSMNENSLTVIQELTENQQKESRSSVVLLKGDLAAKFSSFSRGKNIDISTPSTTVEFDGTDYAISVDDDSTTSFAAYDGNAKLSNEFGSVEVPPMHGTKVEQNKAPEEPRRLLPAPVLIKPLHNFVNNSKEIAFQWLPVNGKKEYKLQLAQSSDFAEIFMEMIIKNETHSLSELANDHYFWRVQAIDPDGLPGPFSPPQRIQIAFDETPPLLILSEPTSKYTNQLRITFAGKTEPGARILINQEQVYPNSSGDFNAAVNLTEGENIFIIQSVDKSGNKTTLDKTITLDTTPPFLKLSDFVEQTNTTGYELRGQTEPNCHLLVNNSLVKIDESGQFVTTLMLKEGANKIMFVLTDPVGLMTQEVRYVEVDITPPIIEINKSSYQALTTDAATRVGGQILGAKRVLMNSQPLILENNRFDMKLTLSEGRNAFYLEAIDNFQNIKTDSIIILRDTTPPQITDKTINPNTVSGGEIVEVNVRVTDGDYGSGLKNFARYLMQSDLGYEYEGAMTYKQATQSYRDQVNVAKNAKGALHLKWIELEDLVGNKHRYDLSKN